MFWLNSFTQSGNQLKNKAKRDRQSVNEMDVENA